MRSTRATLCAFMAVALVAGACNARAGTSGNGPTAIPTASPGGAAAATPTQVPANQSDAHLIVGRKGAAGLATILAGSGEVVTDLPSGAPDPDWSRLVTTAVQGTRTIVRDLAIRPGAAAISAVGGGVTSIDGEWRLPVIGRDPVPVGVSLEGGTIALVAAGAHEATSRFAILRRGFSEPASIVHLPGRFEFDVLSPDGRTLYVVERLDADAGGIYQVRAVDTGTGALADGVIADKRNLETQMAGYPLAQVRLDGGLVLTLYQGERHPFIHALNSAQGWAVCIDLPAHGTDDGATAAYWDLAPAPDGRFAYAVNASLGIVAEVDPGALELRRSVTVTPLVSVGISPTAPAAGDGRPLGRRAVVSPDGGTIYAIAAGGLQAVNTATLRSAWTWESDAGVDAIGVSPDGETVFALDRSGGHIVRVDAAAGLPIGSVPRGGYDRLVAVLARE